MSINCPSILGTGITSHPPHVAVAALAFFASADSRKILILLVVSLVLVRSWRLYSVLHDFNEKSLHEFDRPTLEGIGSQVLIEPTSQARSSDHSLWLEEIIPSEFVRQCGLM